MKPISKFPFVRGFTLVEVLGATAVLVTLATVSIVSIKDTVEAGQKAAAQRELQTLNSALQSFKSAGGTIEEDATVLEALQALKDGIDLAGSEYAPLLEQDPEMSMQIGSEVYDLGYDPEDGFFYEDPDGSSLGASGGEIMALNSGGGSDGTFDPTSSEELATAVAAFSGYVPGSPEYLNALASFNAGLLADAFSEADRRIVHELLANSGLSQVAGQWGEPIFDITDPEVVTAKLAQINNANWEGQMWYQSTDYSENLGALLAAYRYALDNPDENYPNLAASLNTALVAQMLKNVGTGPSPGGVSSINGIPVPYGWGTDFAESRTNLETDWAKLNFTGVSLESRMLSGIPSLTGEQLTQASSLRGSVLAGLNLSGFDPTGKSLYAVNLAGVSNLDTVKLSSATNFIGTSFAGLNLSGFDVSGKNFLGDTNREYGASFANVTGLTGADLNAAARIPANLSGFNMAGFNFAAAGVKEPWGFGRRDFSNITGVTGADLNAFTRADAYKGTNLSGVNLTGLSFSGRTFQGSDLSNTNVTVAQLNGASGNVSIQVNGSWVSRNGGLSGTNLAGLNLTGLNMSNKVLGGNMSGATGVTAAMINGSLLWPSAGDTLDPNSTLVLRNASTGALTVSSGGNRSTRAPGDVWPTGLDWQNLTVIGRPVYGFDATTTGLTGAQLSAAGRPPSSSLTYNDFRSTNFSGMNLAGLDLTNKDFSGANFSNVTGITGADLNNAYSLGQNSMMSTTGARFVNVSGMDMTGFDASIGTRSIAGWNFSNASNLTIAQLQGASKTNLETANFKNSGITKAQLEAAGWTSSQLSKVIFD
jgi:uncharacterized protein YjbI with pentapeptide repeats/type II secretory pathway pseudopilin PulG